MCALYLTFFVPSPQNSITCQIKICVLSAIFWQGDYVEVEEMDIRFQKSEKCIYSNTDALMFQWIQIFQLICSYYTLWRCMIFLRASLPVGWWCYTLEHNLYTDDSNYDFTIMPCIYPTLLYAGILSCCILA